MRANKSISTKTYDMENGYFVDVVTYTYSNGIENQRDAWLCKYGYGIKIFMFGAMNTDLDTFKKMINNNIDLYIEDYERDYSDTQYDD